MNSLAHDYPAVLLRNEHGLVLKAGGDVVMVPAERMPSTTGAAAVYRF